MQFSDFFCRWDWDCNFVVRLHKAFGGKGRLYNCCIDKLLSIVKIWKKTKRNQVRGMFTILRHISGLARASYCHGNTSHHTLCWPEWSVFTRGETRKYMHSNSLYKCLKLKLTEWNCWLHKWLRTCWPTGRVCWLNPWPQVLLLSDKCEYFGLHSAECITVAFIPDYKQIILFLRAFPHLITFKLTKMIDRLVPKVSPNSQHISIVTALWTPGG